MPVFGYLVLCALLVTSHVLSRPRRIEDVFEGDEVNLDLLARLREEMRDFEKEHVELDHHADLFEERLKKLADSRHADSARTAESDLDKARKWQDFVGTMASSKNLPVYSPLLHCRADALQEQRYLSKSCLAGGCPTSNSDCKLCHTCMDLQYRSYFGTCNNLDNIFSGQKGSPFERNIPISELFNHTFSIDKPNIRIVAQKLFRREVFKEHKTVNLLVIAFQQFFFHDFIQRNLDPKNVVSIVVPADDIVNTRGHVLKEIEILGTEFTDFGCPFKFSRDIATAWVDGSQIYGSDAATNTKLRTRQGGKIRLDGKGRLEFENKKPITGHPGGFWVGLYSFHTLFIREHNAICDMLASQYHDWTDDQLFNVARLINSAQIFKAYIADVLPAFLPGSETTLTAKWLWSGITKEEILQDDPEYPGSMKHCHASVLGSLEQDITHPLTTSEDLAVVNRIHATVPDHLEISKPGSFSNTNGNSGVNKPRFSALEFSFENTENLKLAHTDEELLFSMGITRAGAIALKNYPTSYTRTTAEVDKSSSKTMDEIGFDMSMADLLRDRERGTPRYCQYLRALNMPDIPKTFEDLTNGDTDLANDLEEVYGNVEQVDLVIGLHVQSQTMNEGRFPTLTKKVTISQLFRKISSDRFYTTDFNAKTYTPEGMLRIKHSNLKTIIGRHYESLKPIMDQIKNPLVDWDDEAAQNEAPSVDL